MRFNGSRRGGIFRTGALALGASLALAGCGDDSSPTNSGDELSEAEAQVMMDALVEAGGLGTEVLGSSGAMGMDASQPATQTIEVDQSVSCPGGGSVHLTGVLNYDDTGESMDWTMTQVHQGCTATASVDGSTWVFDGAPSVDTDFNVAVGEESFALDGSQVGAVEWTSGGQSGTCGIDLGYTMTMGESSLSIEVAGSVCGHSISESYTGSF